MPEKQTKLINDTEISMRRAAIRMLQCMQDETVSLELAIAISELLGYIEASQAAEEKKREQEGMKL